MVLFGGIEPERLQIFYYQLHCHRVREIRRQNNHTAQTENRSKFDGNTQNMHARKSKNWKVAQAGPNTSVKLHIIYIKHHEHYNLAYGAKQRISVKFCNMPAL